MDVGDALRQAIDAIASTVSNGPVAYLLVFAMSGLDVLFPIIPSEAVVLAAAVLAGSGQLDVRLVVLAAVLGAFLGDNLAHAIGRRMGRPMAERLLRGHIGRLDWLSSQLARHGPTLIISGRFLPGGRSLVAVGSGVLRMRWPEYALVDLVAVVIWALQVVIPGYLGGALFREQPWLGFVVGAVVSLAVVATIEAIRWLVRRRRGEPLPSDLEDRVSSILDEAAARHVRGAVDDGRPGPPDTPAR